MSPPSSPLDQQQNPPAYTPPSPWPLHPPTYEFPSPDEPPPSYDDATNSEAAPLLVGPRIEYGTYAEPDEQSSAETSDIDIEEASLAEYIGQAVVVFLFFLIMYAFWKIASNPPGFLGDLPP